MKYLKLQGTKKIQSFNSHALKLPLGNFNEISQHCFKYACCYYALEFKQEKLRYIIGI